MICISKPEIPDEKGAILETEFNYEEMRRVEKANSEGEGKARDVWNFNFQSRGCGEVDNSITKDCTALQNKPALIAYVEKQIEEEGSRPTGCLFLLCGVIQKHLHLLKDVQLVARTLSHTYWYVLELYLTCGPGILAEMDLMLVFGYMTSLLLWSCSAEQV